MKEVLPITIELITIRVETIPSGVDSATSSDYALKIIRLVYFGTGISKGIDTILNVCEVIAYAPCHGRSQYVTAEDAAGLRVSIGLAKRNQSIHQQGLIKGKPLAEVNLGH